MKSAGPIAARVSTYLRQLRLWYAYLKARVWQGIQALLEACHPSLCWYGSRGAAEPPVCLQEFSPWISWIILDAVMTYIISLLAKKVPAVRSFFEAVGWL
jgi:uncharacterized membrane protein